MRIKKKVEVEIEVEVENKECLGRCKYKYYSFCSLDGALNKLKLNRNMSRYKRTKYCLETFGRGE